MNLKYTIFVSSTYVDLKKEREEIRNAIIKMGHIPVGMEYFPASNNTQWDVIKKLIDESDYYILIIGGRYGSEEKSSGISYTQKEFQYAKDTDKPLLVFVLDRNSKHPSMRNAEKEESIQQKMREFIEQAQTNRLCRYWSTAAGLVADVVISLYHEMDENPQVGWVRAHLSESSKKDEQPKHARVQATKQELLEPWQMLLKYKTLEPDELETSYTSVCASLSSIEYNSVVPLAVINCAFSELHAAKTKLITDDIEHDIRGNFYKVLSSCGNREELYNMKIDYSKTINRLCFQKSMPDIFDILNGYFFSEFDALWSQIRDKMTIALEDITDATAMMPLQLLQEAVPDHSVLYEWYDIFDKVNIDKMVVSIQRLSNKGRHQLASFFIERYKLRYYMENGHQSYARACEVEPLKKLASKLSVLEEQSESTTKISYQHLASVVDKAMLRADGNTSQLMTFNE